MTKSKPRYFNPENSDEKNTNKNLKKKKKPFKKPKVISIQTNLSDKAIKNERIKRHQKEAVISIQTNLSDKAIKNERIKRHQKEARQPKIDQKIVEKYRRGAGIENVRNIKSSLQVSKYKKKEKAYEWSAEQTARAEQLLTEDAGLLEVDDGEVTTQFKQQEILKHVDITAATKHFNLELTDFGPYRARFTRNGRHLLLGGYLGHLAAFDWATKNLHCEINVMESIHDVCWLHIETMFAVAQKKSVYIYDNQGIELHCLKKMNEVLRMEFLPYHFLLATASDRGQLSWLDVSIGEIITQYNTKLGRLSMMTQNPWNAILHVGHAKGVVSLWSPNLREPLAKMLCHKAPMTALAINPSGTYMATSAVDKSLKIWDVRQLSGPLQYYNLQSAPTNLSFSQKNLLALGTGNIVEIYDGCTKTADRAYLRHKMNSTVSSVQFCPYEDVLGIGTSRGYTSILVPGAGEPNFDALEVNPYQGKSQRQEAEVKALLEKIQPELICLDPNTIAEVDIPTLTDKLEAKKNLLFVKKPKLDLEHRKRPNVRRASIKAVKTKNILKEKSKREFIKTMNEVNLAINEEISSKPVLQKPAGVLDRFQSQRRVK